MPVTAACLVPAAPVLLPWLTGTAVPEVAPVRDAVHEALDVLDGCDRVVLVATQVPGTLAGFGSPLPPPVPSRARGSWPHELGHALLDSRPGHDAAPDWRPGREETSWDRVGPDPAASAAWCAAQDARPGTTGLLLLADGSRTRGPRAPGGDDPRGETVDRSLARAARAGRPVPARTRAVAPEVGADACPAVDLLAHLAALPALPLAPVVTGPGRARAAHDPVPTTRPRARVLLAAAPLGVGYLVAAWRAR
ncbi:hypothetical protein [Aquipuribacter nitratireducens]|uniref:Uncharacterized protein n=1 Tax=Aquipuribacter nitratireducens TaxID=650104 RepID=A0ABW0GL36_9MICO